MRLLSTFPLPPRQIQSLTAKGFINEDDLSDVTPVQLSEEINISTEDARELLKVVKSQGTSRCIASGGTSLFQGGSCKTVLQLLEEQEDAISIVTFCAALDEMLGGGIEPCKITEVCGPPGIGKTQLGMQLAVDVQIPTEFGGLGGKAVYIDTEGSFMPERMSTMADAAIMHLQRVAQAEADQDLINGAKDLTVEGFLKSVSVYRCHDYIQLIALSHILEEHLQEVRNVKLIVVDSIAFPFRHGLDDFALRSRMLQGLAQSFLKLASKHNAAVVFINQMTTKLDKANNEYSLVPALGETWGHACTVRVVLSWQGNQRQARLYKSASHGDSTVPFTVTKDGVRDVEGYMVNTDSNDKVVVDPAEELNQPPQKRPKVES